MNEGGREEREGGKGRDGGKGGRNVVCPYYVRNTTKRRKKMDGEVTATPSVGCGLTPS